MALRLATSPGAYPPLPSLLAVSCRRPAARACGGAGSLREGVAAGHGRPAEWARTTAAPRSLESTQPSAGDPTVGTCQLSRRSRTRPGAPHSQIRSRSSRASGSLPAHCWRRTRSSRPSSARRPFATKASSCWAGLRWAALVLALLVAAILLAPWRLKFAVDARELYDQLYKQAAAEADADTLGWLVSAGYLYHDLQAENGASITRMSQLWGLARGSDGPPNAGLARRPGGKLSLWRRSPSHLIRSSRSRPPSASKRVGAQHPRRSRGQTPAATVSSARRSSARFSGVRTKCTPHS